MSFGFQTNLLLASIGMYHSGMPRCAQRLLERRMAKLREPKKRRAKIPKWWIAQDLNGSRRHRFIRKNLRYTA